MNVIHTPTPWRADGQQIVCDDNDYCVAVVCSPDPRARGKERMEDLEYCRGNVAFIVHAANAHDKLVEVLKAVRDLIQTDRSIPLVLIEAALMEAGEPI